MSIDYSSQLQSQINSIFNKQSQTIGGTTAAGNVTCPSAMLLRRQTTKWLQAAKSMPKKMIERSQSQVFSFYNIVFIYCQQ